MSLKVRSKNNIHNIYITPVGRWPEGPFVKSGNDEFLNSKFAILKFIFSKIGNFDFRKLNFLGTFVTAKNSKTG